ncbi:MAG: LytR family transcriptional regulator [Candidatus Saccharibacteria bacterium]|nr:LytR family transcriptional regulator [Candidatus Saccharibacteria bacterium]
MDSSRFKRRETNTKRHSLDQINRGTPVVRRPLRAGQRIPLQDGLVTLSPQAVAAPITPIDPIDVAAQVRMPQPLKPHAPVFNDSEQSPEQEEPEQPRRASRIDMGLPGQASPERQSRIAVIRSRWIAIRRWGFRSVALLLVLIIGIGGFLFSQGIFKAKKVFNGGTTSAAALKPNVNPQLLKGEGDGRINVLLLGRGGGDHDAPDLTDTLMIASIDPVNKTSTLLSVPRDLWVSIPGAGAMKINAAWETAKYKSLGHMDESNSNTAAVNAGFAQIDSTVEEVVGIPIHYNMIVDFQAFKQAVDTVGGVSVNVPTDLVDPTIAWENNNNSVIAKAGVQQFDGKTALLYARSRETSSDFARGERQRAIILGLKEKAKSLGTLTNPLKLSGLINAFGDNVQTDLNINDAARLFGIIKDIDNTNVNSVSLAQEGVSLVTTANLNGQSVVQPKAGQFNYTAIQNYVRSQIKDPYLSKEAAKIVVLNGTTVPGLAGVKAQELTSYGYTVTSTANAPTSGYTTTTIIDMGTGKKYTKNYLEQRYSKTAVTTLPDPLIQANGADFVIIIGSDEATTNQG